MTYRIAAALWLCCSCASRAQCPRPAADSLFRATVVPSLARPLWRGVTAYSSTHELFVPMVAAWEGVFPEWQPAFTRHFGRFARAQHGAPFTANEPLWRAHYLFLASEYLVRSHDAPPELAPVLLESVRYLWNDQSLRLYRAGTFAGVSRRLRARRGERGYVGAIDDLDRLTFATAANLKAARVASGQAGPAWLDSLLVTADSVLHARVQWESDGGWLFQPGAWADHPDMRFAGNTGPEPPSRVRRVPAQAEDASHSMRWPALIAAMRRGEVAMGRGSAFADSLRRGLARQFGVHVLVRPDTAFDGWRTTNFMDGRNGWYRWDTQYHAAGPYELSASLLYGWWVLLDAPVTDSLYRDLAARWPLSSAERALYARTAAEVATDTLLGAVASPIRELDVLSASCLVDRPR